METPRILYHGTTRSYYNKAIKLHGDYKPHGFAIGNPVWLSSDQMLPLEAAISHALNPNEKYGGIPLILIVNSVKVPGIEYGWGCNWKAAFLLGQLRGHD